MQFFHYRKVLFFFLLISIYSISKATCEDLEYYHTGEAEVQENTILNEKNTDSHSDGSLYDELSLEQDDHGIKSEEKVQNSGSGQHNSHIPNLEESHNEHAEKDEVLSPGLASFNGNMKYITGRHRKQLEEYSRELSNVPRLISSIPLWIRKIPIGYSLYCRGLHSLQHLRAAILTRYGKDETVRKHFMTQKDSFYENGLCSETDESALNTQNDQDPLTNEEIRDKSLEIEGEHDEEGNMERFHDSERETILTDSNSDNERNVHGYHSGQNPAFEQKLIAVLRKNPRLHQFMKIIFDLANVLDLIILIGLLYGLFQILKRITSLCEYVYQMKMNSHVGRQRRRRRRDNPLQSAKRFEVLARFFDRFNSTSAETYERYENMYNDNTVIQEDTSSGGATGNVYDVRQDTDRARRESLGSRRTTRSSMHDSKAINNDNDTVESTPRSLKSSSRREMGNSSNRQRRRSISRGEHGSTPSGTRRMRRSSSRNELIDSAGLLTRSQRRRAVQSEN